MSGFFGRVFGNTPGKPTATQAAARDLDDSDDESVEVVDPLLPTAASRASRKQQQSPAYSTNSSQRSSTGNKRAGEATTRRASSLANKQPSSSPSSSASAPRSANGKARRSNLSSTNPSPDGPKKRAHFAVEVDQSARKRRVVDDSEEDGQGEDEEDGEYRPSKKGKVVQESEEEEDQEDEASSPREEPVKRSRGRPQGSKTRAVETRGARKTAKSNAKSKGKAPARKVPARKVQEEVESAESEEDGEEPSSEVEVEESEEWTAPPKELESPELFRELPTIELQDEQEWRARLRKGDAVECTNGGAGDRWIGKIEKLGGLLDDFEDARDADGEVILTNKGKPAQQLNVPWFSVAWLYTRGMFKDLPRSAASWQWSPDHLIPMGKNERVETDHAEWQTKDALALAYSDKPATSGSHLVLRFNDEYPAPSSQNATISSHPLSAFRPPITKKQSEAPFSPPSTFWGDDESDAEDEIAGAPFVRTKFCFQVGAQAEVKVKVGKGGKRRTSTRPDGKAVSFNKHSTSRKPYNPATVQLYGADTQTWYDVADLQKGQHFVKQAPNNAEVFKDMLSDSDDEDEQGEEEQEGAAVDSAMKGVKKELTALAGEQIKRGGAFGLIGNSYLVTRAGELLEVAKDAEGGGGWADEGRRLVREAKEWEEEVARRKKKGMKDGKPPKECEWVLPRAED